MGFSDAKTLWLVCGLTTLTACGGSSPTGPAVAVEELAAPVVAEVTTDELPTIIAEHRATVLVWWSRACPCVRRYDDRVEALSRRWSADDVAVVAVSSNADETPEQVRAEYAARGLTVPLLLDVGGRLAVQLGARSTPTVVVLRPDGSRAFVGWIDNEREPGARGRVPYVENAVDALLGGGEGPTSSPTYGCAIARDLRGGCCNGP